MHVITPIQSPPCRLAEGPLWHAEQQKLYWTDIPEGKLYCHTPATGETVGFYSGEPVGGFTFNRDGTLVLFRVKDVCWIDTTGKILATQPIELEGMVRFNDVSAAPDGSVFAGTIGKTPQSGGLYHFRPDGSVQHLFAGTGCANGMGFSPDRSILYWTCSTRKKIYAYDYRNGEVEVATGRVIYTAPEGENTPDGMTVDRDGDIWSTRWDGACIVRISSSGNKLGSVAMPRARISSACFGGPNLDRLYATAAANQDDGKITPCVYEVKIKGVSGREEFLSQLNPVKELTMVK